MKNNMLPDLYLGHKKELLDKIIVSYIQDDYPHGRKDDPTFIRNRVSSIGNIKSIKYTDKPYLFIALDMYDAAQDDSFRGYRNIEELSAQIIKGNYHSAEEYNLLASETFKITAAPILECIEGINYYRFSENGVSYLVQSIELARALFYINADLINISFQPNALLHLCSVRENDEQFSISFSNLMFANKNLSTHAHRQRLAWLLTNDGARRSFSSIFAKTDYLDNHELVFNFLPPDLSDCHLTFTGFQDEQQDDLFHMKYIEHIDLNYDQIGKNVIFETLNAHQKAKIYEIKKQQKYANEFYADRAFSCFHESIKQLPHHDDGYLNITLKKANKPQFFESESDYQFRSQSLNLNDSYYFSQLEYDNFFFFIIGLKPSIKSKNKTTFRIFCFEKCREKSFFPMIKQFFNHFYQKKNFEWQDYCNAYDELVIDRDLDRKIPLTDDEFYNHCALALHQKIQSLQQSATCRLLDNDKLNLEINALKEKFLDKEYPILCIDKVDIPKATQELITFSKSKELSILTVFGINTEGQKELLGFWVNDNKKTDAISTALTELKAKGLNNTSLIFHNNIQDVEIEKIKNAFPNTNYQSCFSSLLSNASFSKKLDHIDIARHIQGIYASNTQKDAVKELRHLSKYLSYHIEYDEPLKALDTLFGFPSLVRRILFDAHSSLFKLNKAVIKELALLNSCTSMRSIERSIYVASQIASMDWQQPIANWDAKFSALLKNK